MRQLEKREERGGNERRDALIFTVPSLLLRTPDEGTAQNSAAVRKTQPFLKCDLSGLQLVRLCQLESENKNVLGFDRNAFQS